MTHISKIYEKYISIYTQKTVLRKLLGKLTISFMSPCPKPAVTLTSYNRHQETTSHAFSICQFLGVPLSNTTPSSTVTVCCLTDRI